MTASNFSVTTIEAFTDCGYEKIIDACEANVEEYWQELAKASQKAKVDENIVDSSALQLLSLACSLMLKSSDSKQPFSPVAVFKDGSTSIKATDFYKVHIDLFGEFSSLVEYPELAARLADLAWVVKRNIDCANIAILNYVKSCDSSYCHKNWSARIKRFERALRLSLLIKDKLSTDTIGGELISLLDPEHKLYSLIATKRINNLLLEFGLFDPALIGEKIERSLDSQCVSPEFQYELLSIAAKAYLKGKNLLKAKNAKINAAEALVKKAALTKQPGQMIAASHWLSQAINAFQLCEGQQHRVAELQKEIAIVNKECQKEMKTFTTSIDISTMVHDAVLAMQGKDWGEALIQFTYINRPLSRKNLEKQTIDLAKTTIFQSTTEKKILNGDGRLVAIVPPLIGSKGESYDLALKYGCYWQATHHYSLVVQGVILPARDELLKLHQVDEILLANTLQNCAFFPAGRVSLWIKGFVAGFYNDFDVALSLLIPQFEHALRKCLESKGAIVWRVDPVTKFHSEKSLGELLGLPEALEFLGEDLQFELQGLLVEKVGFNFRNESMHGLMSEEAYYSLSAVYLWWLLLHIAVSLSQFSSQ